MKQRIITGTIFFIFIYLFLFLDLFIIPLTFFLLVGIYEMYKMYSIKKEVNSYLISYFIIFLLGILSINTIDFKYDNGNIYLLILLTLIMLNDTLAYFVGKKIGKTKFSKTSPNKTIEGLLGGIVISSFVFLVYLLLIDIPLKITMFSEINIFISLVIVVLLLIFAVIGDLLESKLKRIYGVKDSGTIIKGHGGVLDRIDSWISASIIYFLILSLYL